MTPRDVVVTIPKDLWVGWLAEGDLPGDPQTGEEWAYWLGGHPPKYVTPGQSRVYVVAHSRLRGYAPLVRVYRPPTAGKPVFGLCRRDGAVAMTIEADIKGFRGWRYRWWESAEEHSFLDWRRP